MPWGLQLQITQETRSFGGGLPVTLMAVVDHTLCVKWEVEEGVRVVKGAGVGGEGARVSHLTPEEHRTKSVSERETM